MLGFGCNMLAAGISEVFVVDFGVVRLVVGVFGVRLFIVWAVVCDVSFLAFVWL